jgi:tetratricopeptide (TPR) repeat protein
LPILLKLFDEYNADLAHCYNNIGISYDSIGDHKQALKYKHQSLAIFYKLFGETHANVADSYNNIGITYDNLGDYKQALEY